MRALDVGGLERAHLSTEEDRDAHDEARAHAKHDAHGIGQLIAHHRGREAYAAEQEERHRLDGAPIHARLVPVTAQPPSQQRPDERA